MVQIRLGKIAICQSGLNLLAGKGTRNGVAEVAPHLKEDGDGKGEHDGSCRARTRNDGKRAAKHAGDIDLGRNRRADRDGAHEHGLQSSADDNALLDIAKDQATNRLVNSGRASIVMPNACSSTDAIMRPAQLGGTGQLF